MKEKDRLILEQFEDIIGYKFKNKNYLQIALTHSSYVNEHKMSKDNERLEFLGDSVLGLIVSNYIFAYKSSLKEGDLTKIRSTIVCEKSLMHIAEKLNIGQYIKLGKGEKISGGAKRASILADAVEAMIAAIYLDSDFDNVSKYVLDWLGDTIKNALDNKKSDDYKSKLQEEIQKVRGRILKYELISMKGPDHERIFTIGVYCDNKLIGTGKGHSKKEAEQLAAKDALQNSEKI
jgi:ribonuclease III